MPEEASSKRRGRPKSPEGERKRSNFTFRARDDLRRKLADAAAQSGRSSSEEIEYRLEQSFREEDLLQRFFGSDEAIELLKELSVIINYQLQRSGKSWRSDKATRDAIRSHFLTVFEYFDDEDRAAKLGISREEYERRARTAGRIPAHLRATLSELSRKNERSSERVAGPNESPMELDDVEIPEEDNLSPAMAMFFGKEAKLLATLTSQEVEVLSRLMKGASIKAIAQELGLNSDAVKVHVRSMLRKLLANRRKQPASDPQLRRLLKPLSDHSK